MNELMIAFKIFKISKEAVERWINKKQNETRAIFLKEIRGGNFDNLQEDDRLSIIYQFHVNSQLGTAKNNLILMARVANGMYIQNKLKPDTFLKYSKMLSDLSEEEILMLGTIMKFYLKYKNKHHMNEINITIDSIKSLVHQELPTQKDKFEKSNEVKKKYRAIAFGLLRTGLFNLGSTSREGTIIVTTILFDKFMSYCPNIDDLINKYG